MTQPVTGLYRGAWTTGTPYYVRDVAVFAGVEYTCTVAHTSGATFDTARWVAESLSRTIAETAGIEFSRALLVDSASAVDMLRFLYDGNRTGYHNEYGELRCIPAKTSTVPLRIKQKSAGQTANLTEWVDIGNTVLAAIGPAGELIVAAGAWTDLALPAGMSHGAVHAQCRLEPAGVVRVRGSITSDAGTGFGSGATLATLTAGKRPAAAATFASRQAGAGVALTINTDGTVTSSSAIGSGGGIVVLLDNIALATT